MEGITEGDGGGGCSGEGGGGAGGREKGEGRFERELWLLVESSWAGGPSEHNEFNELQRQLTN